MNIQQLLKDACENHGEVDFRNDYSGRGMYGDTCVGIVGSHSECMEVIADVIKGVRFNLFGELEYENDELFGKTVDTLLTHYSEDNMGRSKIIYWRSLKSIEGVNDAD